MAKIVNFWWHHVVLYVGSIVSQEPASSSFHPEDRGNSFLQNIGTHLPGYMASYPTAP